MLMWCSCNVGHVSWYGGFRSHRHTRCLIPLSRRYWYSEVILGSANPASFPGSTQEKLCGGVEAMLIQLRRDTFKCTNQKTNSAAASSHSTNTASRKSSIALKQSAFEPAVIPLGFQFNSSYTNQKPFLFFT